MHDSRDSGITKASSHAASVQQKHKKNKSQLSYATSNDIPSKVNAINNVGGAKNFGPVHFHNNSGGVQGTAQGMMLDHNGNLIS